MNKKEYNGWTNYETWLVGLWLDNDQYTYETARAVVNREVNRYDAEEALKNLIDEMNPLTDQASLFSDLLRAAISEVNWGEIINHYEEDKEDEN